MIRKGFKEDLPAVLNLIKELAEYEKESNEVVVTLSDMERDGFGENPLFKFFVAEVGETIVGMALYFVKYSTSAFIFSGSNEFARQEMMESLLAI